MRSYPERDWGLAPCSSSPSASSCLLHWFRRPSALRGGWETRIFHCWSPLFFLNKGGKMLPVIVKRGTNKSWVFFFWGKGLTCEWSVLRLFPSPLPSLPPPVKPSDNSGADRVARNKERARNEVWIFFSNSGTKYPPLFLPLYSHYISLFTIAQFIFHCSSISQ